MDFTSITENLTNDEIAKFAMHPILHDKMDFLKIIKLRAAELMKEYLPLYSINSFRLHNKLMLITSYDSGLTVAVENHAEDQYGSFIFEIGFLYDISSLELKHLPDEELFNRFEYCMVERLKEMAMKTIQYANEKVQ